MKDGHKEKIALKDLEINNLKHALKEMKGYVTLSWLDCNHKTYSNYSFKLFEAIELMWKSNGYYILITKTCKVF